MNVCARLFDLWEPLKTGLKRENGKSAPNAMKADEVRLYALRGGLKKQAVCYTHFHSNKVFRGDLIINAMCLLYHSSAEMSSAWLTFEAV